MNDPVLNRDSLLAFIEFIRVSDRAQLSALRDFIREFDCQLRNCPSNRDFIFIVNDFISLILDV